MRVRRRLALALLLCAGTASQASEVADLVNALRAPGSKCNPAPGLAPLAPRPALDKAAAALASGTALADSLNGAGYRFVSVQVMNFSGTTERASMETMMSGQFCAVITAANLVDVGVHQRGSNTWVVIAAPFAPKVSVDEAEAARRMLALVNKARAEARRCGDEDFAPAGPVKWNDTLTRAARGHSEDMARNNYFSHDGLDGSKPAERVARAGYKYRATGENIAAGQMTPEDAVAGWIKSPPHCKNLMKPVYTEMGVAFAVDPKSKMGVYWTQLFGTPR